MIYIPSDWFIDKKNESKVYRLINKETDIVSGPDTVYRKLMELGEITIAEKYRNGELIGYR